MILNREDLFISPLKLSGYLLDEHHIDGGSKAKLLISFGFTILDSALLEKEILNHVLTNEVTKTVTTKFGEKYIVEGKLGNPLGKSIHVRTVWVKELKEKMIKFVTLYPI